MEAPATGADGTLEGIDALLRARWRSGLSELIERAQGRSTRFSDLHWLEIDDGMKASVGADELVITRSDDGDHALLYRWGRRAGKPRELGRGDAADLQRRVAGIIGAGPHGGPDVWDPRNRRLPLLEFAPPAADSVFVASFGRGYEARIAPVDAGCHSLVLVSPRGSFLFLGFGRPINLAIRAYDEALALDVLIDDIPFDRRPFHVVHGGAPHRLTFTDLPGLAGWTETPAGKVFLFALADDELALILEETGGARHLLARDDHRRINGAAVDRNQPDLGSLAPRTFDRDGVAAALGRLSTLAPPIRDGLSRALDDTRARVGMDMARRLIWAIAAAHALGQRDLVALETEALFVWFVARGVLSHVPCERVRRESLRWLAARTGLVSRSRRGSPIWRVHFDLLSKPTPGFMAWIAP